MAKQEFGVGHAAALSNGILLLVLALLNKLLPYLVGETRVWCWTWCGSVKRYPLTSLWSYCSCFLLLFTAVSLYTFGARLLSAKEICHFLGFWCFWEAIIQLRRSWFDVIKTSGTQGFFLSWLLVEMKSSIMDIVEGTGRCKIGFPAGMCIK